MSGENARLERLRTAIRHAGLVPDASFDRRLEEHLPQLAREFGAVYADHPEHERELEAVVVLAARASAARPDDLRHLDKRREGEPAWFLSNRMVGGVCYVDRYAGTLQAMRERIPALCELGLTYLHLMPLFRCPDGNSDGGYAVSSYREVDPRLGTMTDLRDLCGALRANGISPVVDFIFNHTSNEHEWARRALAGEREFEDYYRIYPDRRIPDLFEQTTREIFPDDHPGSFVPLPDGRWIWATFYHFQWDLNYANPAVFRAMAGEMLFLANQGIEILRMDAVAFIWKQLGTSCESLPEAHRLIRAFNALCRIAAPALVFKSEAIVHPDEVVSYIDVAECPISYNPLLMALGWEALATRDARLLQLALDRRQQLPEGCAFVNYVRSHDDIGWTFDDAEARELNIDPGTHRRFLNQFYVGRFPGSFARGEPFQENPRTGDCRIAGTTASLAGVAAGDPLGVDRVVLLHAMALAAAGIPLLYLGDEVGQRNDPSYITRPGEAGDSRWLHRPIRVERFDAGRHGADTPSGAIYRRLLDLIRIRRSTRAFAGNRIHGFQTGVDAVAGLLRPDPETSALFLANFGDLVARVDGARFQSMPGSGRDLVTGRQLTLVDGVELAPCAFLWLAFDPSTGKTGD
ncbi:alpha-amylase family protein [Aureimonas jatrophae]|uniref:Amylosucrase n=1 Tax=Aureimonas jatrophae TaxID=1166073 RepID=A0A1H0KWJ5_9HYPH|nr:alpha-amylase family protein [Aureimonas jatrophae]MBB3948915.1 amylosucrase [Aureimonas jatrophae]SDO60337.1 amylosucrase [Aureimonas jatrophae]